jgi:hypothetical protein
MTRALLLALLVAAVAAPAADRKRDREKECEAVKEEIRKVQARLRRGYRAAEGVRLNAKLLELRKQRAKLCR